MSWLKSVTADTVVVHTRDGRSIRGVLVGAYRTEVALAHASLLHFGGEDQLDGDVIVLRDNVSSPGAGVAHHLAQGNGTYLCVAESGSTGSRRR
ncbi:hypothetical protein KSB_67000 [Ktedonobacter robiniae]|uniref:Uncharacterized protein n=1 Tax=Ktedonobacter robiniae TaxID=2778365 RepID=A0ABQ3V136_9CHLR|nr:hypothetical protein KSB_67000 [Ktedonobacter robiniae]